MSQQVRPCLFEVIVQPSMLNSKTSVHHFYPTNKPESRTFSIVRMALVVTFSLRLCPSASEKIRFRWIFGSHVRRVLCFENGTLLPYCFIFPWKRPYCERLNGWEMTSENQARLGNMTEQT